VDLSSAEKIINDSGIANFILIGETDFKNAQEVRLGYSSFKNGMKSFPMLVVAILKKTYYYNLNSIKAVESRLGKEFIFSHRKYKKIGFETIFVIIIVVINLYLVVK